jgi:hypothetical protein
MAPETPDLRSPQERLAVLLQGVEILDVVLAPAGFVLTETDCGTSSGGSFATGVLTCADRALSLSYRYSLGEVSYRWGETNVGHSDYLRALRVKGAYPGFSKEPLDGFRHLLVDLKGPLAGFVNGDRTDFDLASKQAGSQERWLP